MTFSKQGEKMTNSIAIFCGSAVGTDSIFLDTAQKMGQTIAGQGKTLVYGGGRSGLMVFRVPWWIGNLHIHI